MIIIVNNLSYFRRYTAQQQQQQRGSRGFPGQPGTQGFRTGAPNWSFVFDPAGRLCYYWSMIVSLAFLYNFWVIIYRFAFQEINGQSSSSFIFCNCSFFFSFLYFQSIASHPNIHFVFNKSPSCYIIYCLNRPSYFYSFLLLDFVFFFCLFFLNRRNIGGVVLP